jgi:hypothetical protein
MMSFFDSGGMHVAAQTRNPIAGIEDMYCSASFAELVCDVTIGEGESVPPGTTFQKTWRLRNSGQEVWPENSALVRIQVAVRACA